MSDEISMFLDMPASEYHADKNVVGHSGLVSMLTTPKSYHYELTRGRVATPAMEFGTLFHLRVLEPDLFKSQAVVKPKFDLRTKEGKSANAAWESENKGKMAIAEADKEAVEGMLDSINEHDECALYLANSYKERSYFWVDEDTGIQCRIRLDMLVFDENGRIVKICDLKKTLNASKPKFRREIGDRGYDLQAAFYSDAVSRLLGRRIPFFFIAVEATAPYNIAIYEAGDITLETGRQKYRNALQLLEWCRKNDRWPSYQPYGESEKIEITEWQSRSVFEYEE